MTQEDRNLIDAIWTDGTIENFEYAKIFNVFHEIMTNIFNDNDLKGTTRQIAKTLRQYQRDFHYEDWVRPILLGVASTDSSKISWADRVCDVIDLRRRKMSSVFKFLQKFLPDIYLKIHSENITESDLFSGTNLEREYEIFTTAWNKHTMSSEVNWEFDVLSGDDIQELAYNERFTGINSCMSAPNGYDDMEDNQIRAHSLYRAHDHLVQCVLIKKNGKIKGRSLLWKLDGGKTAIDRIYPTDGGDHEKALRDYARMREWIDLRNTREEYTVTFDAGENDYDGLPYMDTLKFGTWNGVTLKASNKPTGSHFVMDMHGSEMGEDLRYGKAYTCHDCGERVNEDNIYETANGHEVCRDCIESSYCMVSDEWHNYDDCVFSGYYEDSILAENAVFSDYLDSYLDRYDPSVHRSLNNGDWLHENHDDAVRTHDDIWAWRSDVVELIDAQYAEQSDCVKSIFHDSYILSEYAEFSKKMDDYIDPDSPDVCLAIVETDGTEDYVPTDKAVKFNKKLYHHELMVSHFDGSAHPMMDSVKINGLWFAKMTPLRTNHVAILQTLLVVLG